MPNQQILILDEQYNCCPPEMIGEIFIGGIGIAINYWNDHEKTKHNFIAHPKFGKLYKTGDFGKWTQEGYVDFIGRKNSIILCDGKELRLNQIALSISKLDNVEDCVVVMQFYEQVYSIIVYYTGQKQSDSSILYQLQQFSDTYYIKIVIQYLEQMPLTSNGKIDRKKLSDSVFIM